MVDCDYCNSNIPSRAYGVNRLSYTDDGSVKHHKQFLYCQECYRNEITADNRLTWLAGSLNVLLDTLKASQGSLVANVSPMFIGGKATTRIKYTEGELERCLDYHDGGTEFERVDDEFLELLEKGDMPIAVKLEEPSDTPFKDESENHTPEKD